MCYSIQSEINGIDNAAPFARSRRVTFADIRARVMPHMGSRDRNDAQCERCVPFCMYKEGEKGKKVSPATSPRHRCCTAVREVKQAGTAAAAAGVHTGREITSRSANGVFADAVREKLRELLARIRNCRSTFRRRANCTRLWYQIIFAMRN